MVLSVNREVIPSQGEDYCGLSESNHIFFSGLAKMSAYPVNSWTIHSKSWRIDVSPAKIGTIETACAIWGGGNAEDVLADNTAIHHILTFLAISLLGAI